MTKYADTLTRIEGVPETIPNLTARTRPTWRMTHEDRGAEHVPQRFCEDAIGVMLRPDLAEHPDFHDGWSGMRLRQVVLDQPHAEQRERITVTSQDQHRLHRMLSAQEDALSSANKLAADLRDAHVVCTSCVSRDVITMNSKVVYEDLRTNERLEVQLVYPEDAQLRGRVSVLDALGGALLGRSVGTCVKWSEQDQLRLVGIPYQPEAAGDRHL
jgi:regulator of nucleoside diphosphate kinase